MKIKNLLNRYKLRKLKTTAPKVLFPFEIGTNVQLSNPERVGVVVSALGDKYTILLDDGTYLLRYHHTLRKLY